MPRGKALDKSLLAMALVGYEIEKKKIEGKISEIRAKLGRGRVTADAEPAMKSGKRKRRKLSAAARKRIAVAQKKRWAEHRKATAQTAKS
jgi:hypothetical protein